MSKVGLYPPRCAAAVRAAVDPVFSHHCPAVSPGTEIMALTNTSICTRTLAQTNGAVKPASDCATRITWRAPIASMTRSAYAETARVFVVTSQINRDRVVPGLFEERHDAMPVPSHAASTGNKNKCSHGSVFPIDCDGESYLSG
jgi:hypothetical protein